jgi:hypothetical protein
VLRVKKFRVGDLVYLPSHFILTMVNDDGTIREYCELKVPYVSVLLREHQTHSDLFYRGSVWTTPNDMLLLCVAKGERNVSHTN